MGTLAITPTRTLMFINENEGWEKTITSQSNEIPILKELLTDKPDTGVSPSSESAYFQEALSNLKKELSMLSELLKEQQQRLNDDIVAMEFYNFDALCSQDILRNRIREAQQHFIEMKCNFLRYLSAAI